MVGAGVLAYIAGAASGFVKDIAKSATNALKKKVTGPINKAIGSVDKKPPEPVLKSVEGTNLGTGEALQPASSLERGGGNYGPTKTYAGKEPAYTDKTYEGSKEPYQGKAAALLVPLIIGVGWLAYIFLVGRSDIAAGQLSPSSINRQIFLLSLFIIIYSIFLILFSIGKGKAKKNIKKVKKKKK